MRTRLILLTLLILSAGTVYAQNDNDDFTQRMQQQQQEVFQQQEQQFQESLDQTMKEQEAISVQNEADFKAHVEAFMNHNNNDFGNNEVQPRLPSAAKPQLSLKSGKYNAVQSVTITDSMPGATIYYTTSGGSPTTGSDRYTGPVSIVDTTKLQAIAVAPGFSRSRTTSAKYTLKVTPPPLLLVVQEQTPQHTLTDNMFGAKIYYTLDGSTPTTSSTLYTGIVLPGNVSIKAIAVAPGYAPSVERDFL
jgi:hypothetical protein